MLGRSTKKIRYAVVGLGYIAQIAVLPAFKNARKNSVLTALVSGDPDKLKTLGEKYHIDKRYLYSEFEGCLKRGEVDAVYIATPNSYHRNIMEVAAKYGVHVLCEKPMAVTSEDCLAMLQAAEKNHIKLMIAYRLHFEAANLEAIQLAQSNKLGDLKLFTSTFSFQVKDKQNIRLEELSRGGGPLYDIGIYCINAARYLFRSEPLEVVALAGSSPDSRFKHNDEALAVVMKFSDGRLANFSVSFGAFDCSDYDLVGTKGRLRLEKGYEYATTMRLKLYSENKVNIKKFSKRDQFAPELLYFSDCILQNKRPEPSGEEGLADIRIIEGILLSLELKAPVVLEDIPKKVRPKPDQKITRPPIPRPKLVQVTGPSGEKH